MQPPGLVHVQGFKAAPDLQHQAQGQAVVGVEAGVAQLRAAQALHRLLTLSPGRYLVVSHGGLLNQVMYVVMGTTPHANSSGPRFRFDNTGFAHVIYQPESHRWQIYTVNDHAHWNGKDSD